MNGFTDIKAEFDITDIQTLQAYAQATYMNGVVPPDPVDQETTWGFQDFTVPSNSVTVAVGESIQSAIDSMFALGGGTVNLAAGNHTGYQINIKSNVDVVGAGIDVTYVSSSGGSGQPLFITRTIYDGVENMKLRNMSIDGTGIIEANIVEFSYGNYSNILCENLKVYSTSGTSKSRIIFYNTSEAAQGTNVTVRNCETYGAAEPTHGIALRFIESGVVHNCHSYDNKSIGVDFSRVKYGELSHNDLHDNWYQGTKFPGCIYVYIHDNTIYDNNYYGDQAAGMKFNLLCGEVNYGAQYIHLKDNTVDNCNGGVIDWNIDCTPPTMQEFVTEGNVLTNNVWQGADQNKMKIQGINDGHEFGASQQGIIEEFGTGSVNNITYHATGTPAQSNVGWTTWGDPVS